jgi:hypothetical protein
VATSLTRGWRAFMRNQRGINVGTPRLPANQESIEYRQPGYYV